MSATIKVTLTKPSTIRVGVWERGETLTAYAYPADLSAFINALDESSALDFTEGDGLYPLDMWEGDDYKEVLDTLPADIRDTLPTAPAGWETENLTITIYR